MARSTGLLLLALLVAFPGLATRAETAWSADEIKQVTSLGPWPPPMRPDPGNRVSGQAKAIELGRRLFSDARMSPVGYIACVTCHQPDRSFTDNKARAHGLADLPRNTPALANVRLQRWLGWGGASDSLWMASIRPILDTREFDGSTASVAKLFVRDPELAACYRQVFKESPQARPERTLVNVGKALAAFQETLMTARTPFDDFRDALVRGDRAAAATYPAAAQRGLKLFVGPGGCIACHSGPNFSDGEFHRVAPPGDSAVLGLDDGGRLDDARRLKSSALNLLGAHNDDRSRGNGDATRALIVNDALRGRFRTPGLRNVAVTPPYLHNGSVERLQDALAHASALSARQIDDLAAFLASLSDTYGERRPWSSAGLSGCP
jgi:cytochrome c peroxidase